MFVFNVLFWCCPHLLCSLFFSHNLTALKHKMAEFQLILGGTMWLFSVVILCVTGVGDSFMYE